MRPVPLPASCTGDTAQVDVGRGRACRPRGEGAHALLWLLSSCSGSSWTRPLVSSSWLGVSSSGFGCWLLTFSSTRSCRDRETTNVGPESSRNGRRAGHRPSPG